MTTARLAPVAASQFQRDRPFRTIGSIPDLDTMEVRRERERALRAQRRQDHRDRFFAENRIGFLVLLWLLMYCDTWVCCRTEVNAYLCEKASQLSSIMLCLWQRTVHCAVNRAGTRTVAWFNII